MKNGQIEEVLSLIKHGRRFVTLGADCSANGILKKSLFPSKRGADPRKSSRIIEEDGIQPQGQPGGVCTCFPIVSRKNLLPQILQLDQVAVDGSCMGNS